MATFFHIIAYKTGYVHPLHGKPSYELQTPQRTVESLDSQSQSPTIAYSMYMEITDNETWVGVHGI